MNHDPSNPLIGFLGQQKKFTLSVLLNVFQRLSLQQSKQGQFVYHDVVQIFVSSIPLDVDSYVRLFYEAALVPASGFPYNHQNPTLQVKREVLGNEYVFTRALLNILVATSGGYHHPTIETLEAEIDEYFNPPQAHYLQSGTRSIPAPSVHLYPPRPEIPLSNVSKIPTSAYYPQHVPQPHARNNIPSYQTSQPTIPTTHVLHHQSSPVMPSYAPSHAPTTTTYHQPQPYTATQPQAARYHRQPSLPTTLPTEYGMNRSRSAPFYPTHQQPPQQSHHTHHPQHTTAYTPQAQHTQHTQHTQRSRHQHSFDQLPPQILNAPNFIQAGIEFEKLDPIVRFLAQIRKYGMDVLYPQIIHDKVSTISILLGGQC
jgi:hypothetical protein